MSQASTTCADHWYSHEVLAAVVARRSILKITCDDGQTLLHSIQCVVDIWGVGESSGMTSTTPYRTHQMKIAQTSRQQRNMNQSVAPHTNSKQT